MGKGISRYSPTFFLVCGVYPELVSRSLRFASDIPAQPSEVLCSCWLASALCAS